jgi:tRNA/rRNA methyltransferase
MPAPGTPGPAIILMRPQMGENIGAAARGMWNFGLDRLRLVAPRDGWPSDKARAVASGAARVLDQTGVFDSLDAALADLTFVFATTARPRELTKVVMTPEAAMRKASDLVAAGEKVGILFGAEKSGLSNGDLSRVQVIISVPVNPGFGSLNLGQSVTLLAYEWLKAGHAGPAEVFAGEARLATRVELERLADHLIADLDAIGFFFPPQKRPGMVENLRNLFLRQTFSEAEVRTLHGIMRAFARKRG